MTAFGIRGLSCLLSPTLSAYLGQGGVRVALAALTAALLVLFLGPFVIRKLLGMKVGQPIRNYKGFLLAELHKQKKNTPTMGGLLIIFSVLLSILLWADWSCFFVPTIVGAMCFFGAIGAVDDYAKLKSQSSRGLSGKVRLALQTCWTAGIIVLLAHPQFIEAMGFSLPTVCLGGKAITWKLWQAWSSFPFMAQPLLVAPLYVWILQWFTIVGSANAVNLTDGLDGLASGCSIATGAVLGFAAFGMGQASSPGLFVASSPEVAVCLSAVCGACFGFLWFNTFPAQVFMGDTGSLAIGGVLGTAAVLLKREWFLAMVGAIFVVETLSVIIQVLSFRRTGRRIFRCAPLHHHFEYGGLHEAKVVVRFWMAAVLFAFLGLAVA